MTNLGTILGSKIAHLFGKHPGAKSARLTAQVHANGGTATTVNLNMAASRTEDGTRTHLSARLDAEGTSISAADDTADQTGSRLRELSTRLQKKSAMAQVIAAAEVKDADADSSTRTS